MSVKKCYSVQDLVNISGAPSQSVVPVMDFLSKYGFVLRMGESEPVYSRSDSRLSPCKSATLLEIMTTV